MDIQNQKAKLARQYLAKFPNTSQNAIAKTLFHDFPAIFSSVESARDCVRHNAGTKTCGKSKDGVKRYLKNPVPHNSGHTRENPYGLPESNAKERCFAYLPDGVKKVLVLSDIHFPNQDNRALTAALDYGKKNKIDCILLNGDILDNEPFTNHNAPPPILTDVRKWFEMVSDFLDMLQKKFKAPIIWLEGNHDNWYKRYLMNKAALLFHDEYYTLPARLSLREKNITWYNENVVLMAGKLPITHGHMIVKGFFSPVNPARGVFNKIKSSMLIGHCHQTSEHSESYLNNEIITTYSTGCLCSLAPDYDPFNTRHNQGFAMIEIHEGGNYRVHNKRIDYTSKEIY